MNARSIPATALLAALFVSAPASAQLADFVLFGRGDAEVPTVDQDHTFVHPISDPYFHEDSFVTSDVRGWLLYHDFPRSSAIAGGRAVVGAIQVRLARCTFRL